MRVAIDAMGGDSGPSAVIAGVAAFLSEDDRTQLVLVGQEEKLVPLLSSHGIKSDSRVEIHPASQVIAMDEKLIAVRQKRDASITRAVELVRDGKADAVVAVGNTVAAVAISQLRLRMIEGVGRPGLAASLPSLEGNTLVLDMGANTVAKVEHLVAYGVMGSIYSELILRKHNPSVGLLNVGEELGKGNDLLKETYEQLEKAPINFIGNVEGGDIFRGKCDIVVCDGLVGNAILKASEAAAEMVVSFLKDSMSKGLRRKFGALLCMPAFRELKGSIDYAEFGGAMLLGVNGIVIKGHGRSDARAVHNAIKVARDSALHDITTKIRERMKTLEAEANGTHQTPGIATTDRAAG
jgi:glycerol-3-phosphate acyltransferase PlsX